MIILGIFFTIHELYILVSHSNRLDEVILKDDTMYRLTEN